MVNGIYVIDSHCHIYPEKIAARAAEGTSVFYDGAPISGKGTTADLKEHAVRAGIDHCIVQSVATTPKQVKSINEFIAAKVKSGDELFTGLGTMHPESEDLRGDFEHLKELGLKGIKMHPDIQRFCIDDPRCMSIYEMCEGAGIPVLLHTGDNRYDFSNPNRLLPTVKAFPKLTFIGAHFGGWSIWDEASRIMAGLDNFYVDCSSSMPWIGTEKAFELVRRYGAERVLFGTDYPMWNPKAELDAFLSIPLDENEIRSILNINAKKLFFRSEVK